MAIKEWAEFFPEIMPSLKDCPIPIVNNELRKSSIELCKQSKRLKFEMSPFSTVAETFEYTLDPGTGYKTITILDGSLNGRPIDALRRDELARISDWRSDQGEPSRYLMVEDTETVRLWRTPDAVYYVILTLAIMPTRDADGIEEWFADRFMDGIVSGALAKLMAMPEKPWSNANLAIYHAGEFEKAINKATAEAVKDATRAPLRTTRYGRA